MAAARRGVEHLLDLQAITDLLHRYARALDDKDWSLLATCFTADAVALYGAALGRQEGFAAIEKVCRTALGHLDSSQHMISNPEIRIDGDTATARCSVHAQHTKAGTPGGDNMTIGGTYRDELVRTADGWRIRRRELLFLWQEGNQAVLGG